MEDMMVVARPARSAGAVEPVHDIEAAFALSEADEAVRQIKDQAHEKTQAKARASKAQAAADALPPSEARAGGALVAAKTTPDAEQETKLTSKQAFGGETPVVSKLQLCHEASLRGAGMLAVICERAFLEHQLAASHFTFLNFCEHAPAVARVCRVLTALTAGRAILCPDEHFDRRHVHLGVHRRRF